jgi:hypothetical protein
MDKKTRYRQNAQFSQSHQVKFNLRYENIAENFNQTGGELFVLMQYPIYCLSAILQIANSDCKHTIKLFHIL